MPVDPNAPVRISAFNLMMTTVLRTTDGKELLDPVFEPRHLQGAIR
jgi:hypothetical protein